MYAKLEKNEFVAKFTARENVHNFFHLTSIRLM